MAQYANLFVLVLVFVCASIWLFTGRPLYAVVYFITFRVVFAVAAYLQIGAFGSIPFFIPAFAVFAIDAVVIIARRGWFYSLNGVMTLYLSFLIAAFAATLISSFYYNDIGSLIIIAKQLLTFPIYIVTALAIQTERDLQRATTGVVVIGIVPLAVGLMQSATGVSYDYARDAFIEGIRPVGTIIDANLYGIFLACILCGILPIAMKPNRPWYRVLLVALLVAILLSKNRGTWIAVVLGFVAAAPFFLHKINIGRWIAVGGVLAAVAAPIVVERFQDLNRVDQYGQSQDTFSERLQQSIYLITTSTESPFWGFGAGSAEMKWGGVGLVRPPHNDYVRILYEFGYFAGGLYIFFLIGSAIWFIRNKHSTNWNYMFAGLVLSVYLIVISFSQNLLYDSIVYSLIMYLLAIYHRAPLVTGERSVRVERETADLLRYMNRLSAQKSPGPGGRLVNRGRPT